MACYRRSSSSRPGNGFPAFCAEIKGKKIAQTRRDASIHAERRVVYCVFDHQRLGESINGRLHRGGNGVGRYDGRIAPQRKNPRPDADNEQSVTQWILLLLGYTRLLSGMTTESGESRRRR